MRKVQCYNADVLAIEKLINEFQESVKHAQLPLKVSYILRKNQKSFAKQAVLIEERRNEIIKKYVSFTESGEPEFETITDETGKNEKRIKFTNLEELNSELEALMKEGNVIEISELIIDDVMLRAEININNEQANKLWDIIYIFNEWKGLENS